MPTVFRGVAVAVRAFGAVFVAATALCIVIGRFDLSLNLIRATLILIVVPTLIWLGGTVWVWQQTKKLGPFSMSDRSGRPLSLPETLLSMDADLRQLGFQPIGQFEVDTAWPEKRPRAYSVYADPTKPVLSAGLSFTLSTASFASYWQDGRHLETIFPSRNLPAATLPPWMKVQFDDQGIGSALGLHLATLAQLEQIAGQPAEVATLGAVMDLEAIGMRRSHAYYAEQTHTFVVQQARLAAYCIPAWLVLSVLAFTLHY